MYNQNKTLYNTNIKYIIKISILQHLSNHTLIFKIKLYLAVWSKKLSLNVLYLSSKLKKKTRIKEFENGSWTTQVFKDTQKALGDFKNNQKSFNLFISLIELKNIYSKHPLKEDRCKFKINKISYSKSQSRTTYDVSKNKPSLYP